MTQFSLSSVRSVGFSAFALFDSAAFGIAFAMKAVGSCGLTDSWVSPPVLQDIWFNYWHPSSLTLICLIVSLAQNSFADLKWINREESMILYLSIWNLSDYTLSYFLTAWRKCIPLPRKLTRKVGSWSLLTSFYPSFKISTHAHLKKAL